MQVLSIVLVVVGLAAWAAAIMAGIRVWAASPAGAKVANYFLMGSWRFANLEARLGPSIHPALRQYRIAFIVFILCVLVALATHAMTLDQVVS